MATYWEKLKDPRWQRKRLEVMERADFACEHCEATEKTLNVHHKLYRKGADPWDYADFELVCLCEDCHEQEHKLRARLQEALSFSGIVELEMVAGYAIGLFWRNLGPDPAGVVTVLSYEHAIGIGAAFGLEPEDVIANVDEGSVPVTTLHELRIQKKNR